MIHSHVFCVDHSCVHVRYSFDHSDEETSIFSHIQQLKNQLIQSMGDAIMEIVPAYHEVALFFHQSYSAYDYLESIESLSSQLSNEGPFLNTSTVCTLLPVCYEPPFALDIEEVEGKTDLDRTTLIERHSQTTYSVLFNGFLPGFPYLYGMDPSLCCPRKKEARKRIPSGSVGIAGKQTGVYPSSSPGGWQIIGRTPVPLFLVDATPPVLLEAGSTLRFNPISKEEFDHIQLLVERGDYSPEKVQL